MKIKKIHSKQRLKVKVNKKYFQKRSAHTPLRRDEKSNCTEVLIFRLPTATAIAVKPPGEIKKKTQIDACE